MKFTTAICAAAKTAMNGGASRSAAYKAAFAAAGFETALNSGLPFILEWLTVNFETRRKIVVGAFEGASWSYFTPQKPKRAGLLYRFWAIEDGQTVFNSLYEGMLISLKKI